jgi:hypothetical protein
LNIERDLPVETIQSWFRLMPNLEILSAPELRHDVFLPDNLFRLEGKTWTSLDLDILCSKGDFAGLEEATSLKKMRVWDVYQPVGEPFRAVEVPPSLQTLDLRCHAESSWRGPSNTALLRPPPDSQLQNLRFSLHASKLAHLPELTQLRYLSICNIGEFNHNLAPLTQLPHLYRLSLSLSRSTGVDSALRNLLGNLPSSLYRLDFPSSVPCDILTSTLQSDSSLPVSQLGVSEIENSRPAKKREMDLLRRLCSAGGVDVYYLGVRDPIFGTHCFLHFFEFLSVIFLTARRFDRFPLKPLSFEGRPLSFSCFFCVYALHLWWTHSCPFDKLSVVCFSLDCCSSFFDA